MKQILIYILALVLLGISCFAAAELDITSLTDLTASPNQGIISGSFIATNTGDQNLTGIFFSGNYVNGSSVVVSYLTSNMSLLVGNSQTFNYNIDITNQKAASYGLSLSAQADGLSSLPLTGDISSNLVISPVSSVGVSINPSSITLVAGSTGNIAMSIQNTGNTDISQSYSVLSNSIGTDTSSKSYSVSYGQTSLFNIPITVNSGTPVTSYILTVRVYYTPSNYFDTQFTVTVVNSGTSFLVSGTTTPQTVNLAESNTYTFTVSNLGTTTSNYNVAFSGLSSFVNVSYYPSSFSLSSGSSQIVTVTVDNTNHNNGNDNQAQDTNYDSIYTGTFTVTSGGNSSTYTLALVTQNEIEIDTSSIQTYVNGVRSSRTIKAQPGDSVEIKFNVKNLYTRSDDIDISDYTVTASIDGIDNGDALDLPDYNGNTISRNEKNEVTFDFTVPYITDVGNNQINLEVSATDNNGNTFDQTYNGMSVNVEKNSHNLIFDNLKLDNNVVTCDYPTLRYTGHLVNVGRNDEKDVQITSEILGQTKYTVTSMETINENDYQTLSDSFDLSDLSNGAYTLRVTAVYDGSTQVESDLSFKVDCEQQQNIVVTPTQNTQNTVPPVNNLPTQSLPTQNSVVSSGLGPSTSNMIYIVVLLVLIVVVFVAIILLLFKLAKK